MLSVKTQFFIQRQRKAAFVGGIILAALLLGCPAGAQLPQIDGTQIYPGTTPLSALSTSGASSGQVPQFNGSSIIWSTIAGSGLTVTDGAHSVSSVTTLDFTSGATVSSGGIGTADVAISGGGSGITSLTGPNGVSWSVSGATATGTWANQQPYYFLYTDSNMAGQPSWNAMSAPALAPSPSNNTFLEFTTAGGLSWSGLPAINLAASGSGGVTGTLPVGNGGTGQSSYTDGQLLIGDSSTGGLDKATLTAGANVTITNGHGTITIAASGGGGGGNPTVSKVYGTGTSYSNTASWAPLAFGNGTLAVTVPSAGKYHLTGLLDLYGLSSSTANIGVCLYDSTAGAYLPFSATLFAPNGTLSGSSGRISIPIDCVATTTGADTVQAYCFGGTATSTSAPSPQGGFYASHSWLAYEPVSSSSANSQIANSWPSGLPTPVSHYDASAITGVSNGGNVTSWSDSGSAGLALAPSGGSPTYATYVSNFWQGMPAVQFQGSTTKYVTSSVPTTSTAFDMWYVGTMNPTANSNDAYFYNGLAGSNGYGLVLGTSMSAYTIAALMGGVVTGTPAYPVPQNGLHICEIQRSSGSVSFYVDGVSISSTSGPNAPTGSLTMGVQSGTPTFTRDCCEAILFSSALSTANQSALLAYLQAKWHL